MLPRIAISRAGSLGSCKGEAVLNQFVSDFGWDRISDGRIGGGRRVHIARAGSRRGFRCRRLDPARGRRPIIRHHRGNGRPDGGEYDHRRYESVPDRNS